MERRHILRLRDAEPVKLYIQQCQQQSSPLLPTMSSRVSTLGDAPSECPTSQHVPAASVPLPAMPAASVPLPAMPAASVPLPAMPAASVPLPAMPAASVRPGVPDPGSWFLLAVARELSGTLPASRAHPAGRSPRTPANHPKPPKPKKAEQTTQKNDLSRFPSIHLSPNDIPKPFRSYIPGTYTPLSFTYIPSGVLRLLYISPLTGSR